MTRPLPDKRRAITRLNFVGLGTVMLLVVGVGGWAATSQITGAIVAPGSLVVESSVKKVQHPTGGILGALLVEEGSEVEAGQVLVRLDDMVPRTTLGIIRSELDALVLREARLRAERDGTETLRFPDALSARHDEEAVAQAFAGEERLFEARRSTLGGQAAQLRERIVQLNEEIRGLEAQREAADRQLALTAQELVGASELFAKELVAAERVVALQREQARLEGQRGQLIADIARARGNVSETELQVIQLEKEFRAEALDELREVDAKASELRQRWIAAEDELRRIEIRAPQSGIVHELAVHTVGGVIGAGETILSIVPEADRLVIDAKVAPQDVDQLEVGAIVSARILAANQRVTPTLLANVTRIPADLTRDPETNSAYYLVRIALKEDASNIRHLHLRPGMPVEVYVATEDRTPLQYLLKPIGEQMARAFRER